MNLPRDYISALLLRYGLPGLVERLVAHPRSGIFASEELVGVPEWPQEATMLRDESRHAVLSFFDDAVGPANQSIQRNAGKVSGFHGFAPGARRC